MLVKSLSLVVVLSSFFYLQESISQTNSYFKNTITDDVIYDGLEFETNYYFLMSSGVFSAEADYILWEMKDYDNYLLKFDDNFNLVDSIFFDSINGYNIKYLRFNTIEDTLILLGRALKNDVSDEQISIAKYLLPSLEFLDQQFYGEPDIFEGVNDFLIDHRGNIVISVSNSTYFTNRNLIIMEINKTGNLINYINNLDLDVNWSSIYQMPTTLDYIFNNDYKTIIFDSTLSNYNIFWNASPYQFRYSGLKCKYNDSTYITGGNRFTGIPGTELWVISYYVVNDRLEHIDSSFIYISDTIDKIGGLGFISPSTVIYGGTHNRNWSQQTPETFEEEPRWIILKSEDIITKNENWFFSYGGDANYVMRNILLTENNSCIVSCTRYDWENTDVWQRDVLIFEVDSNGIIISSNTSEEILFTTIYPNPGKNNLSIRCGFNSGTIKIINLTGMTIIEKPICNFDNIDVTGLKPGMYIIMFFENDKFMFSQKWIKT